MHHRSFYWQISALCFVLGLLLAAAWHTTVGISRAGGAQLPVGFSNLSYEAAKESAKKEKYETEIKTQRSRIAELENTLAERGGAAETLNKELQGMKSLLGITEVQGPGVVISVTDSKKPPINPTDQITQAHLIHDDDIGNIVNELKAAGAEAIAVNNHRVVSSTSIRCVGPAIQVNGQPVAPPILIRAIGDAETLFTGLDMPGGVLDKVRKYDPAMVRLEKKSKVRIPPFSGTTQFQYAKSVKTDENSSEERPSSSKRENRQ
jgi:uncharacterized protein YlxW (UPF0749 family)